MATDFCDKRIDSQEAEKSDYVSCIFKPRLALTPIALALGVWFWRYFTLPDAIEKMYAWTVLGVYGVCLCYMAMMEKNRQDFPVFMQWGLGVIILGAVWINQIVGVQFFLLLLISWIWFALLTYFPYTFFRKGKRRIAILIFAGILIVGGLLYPITGGVFLNQYYREVLLSNTDNDAVQEIHFRQNPKKHEKNIRRAANAKEEKALLPRGKISCKFGSFSPPSFDFLIPRQYTVIS